MRHLTTFRVVDAVARTGSIRRAAETLALTPSAVQRRIAAFEGELGQPIFERHPTGLRLNAAGEMVVHHIRVEFAETDRLHSRLADLSGLRRGHVAIACSQALAPHFLPSEIAAYRAAFPQVTFDVRVVDQVAASDALEDFAVDLALVYGVDDRPTIDVIAAVPQDIAAVTARDHPLAARGQKVRLRDLLAYPLALPTRSFEGRRLFDRSMARKGFAVAPQLESNSFEFLKAHVACTDAVAIQIPLGAGSTSETGITSLPIAAQDVAPGMLTLRQLKGRTLSVAAARFADRIRTALSDRVAAG